MSARRRAARLVVALLIIVASLASAEGAIAAATAAPLGALTPLTGVGSCLGGLGCVPLRGVTATTDSTNTSSSDLNLTAGDGGQTMYVTGGIGTPWAIAVLSVNRSTGALSQLSGKRGCISTRLTTGCTFVPAPGHIGDLTISPDGTRVAVESFPPGASAESDQLLARDPRTGTLRRLGDARRCLAMIDHACGHLRGLRLKSTREFPLAGDSRDSFGLTANTRIVTSRQADSTYGAGIAVLRRDAKGRWHEVSGSAGCLNSRGHSGCRKLGCLKYQVSGAAVGDGHVYMIGGGSDTGYVATFRRVRSGGLEPVGCVTFAPHTPTGKPVWVQPLPHSSTVLIAAHYFDHEEPLDREQIYASTPGNNGALTRPRPISGALAFAAGEVPALSRDGTTLYGADYFPAGNGGLYVYQVTSNAVTALPAPWFNPYSTPEAANGLHDNGVNDTPVVSPDGRFVYTITGPFQNPSITNQPEIHVYKVQR